MGDLISRQAAIEIIQSMYPGMPRVPWMRKDWQKRYEPYIRTENAIRELPSVTPKSDQCEDAVSRNEFLKRIEPYNTSDKMDKALYNFAFNKIIGCSSVTPKCKTGKWITKSTNGEMFDVCSICGHIEWNAPSKFCSNCGSFNGGADVDE